MNTLESYVGEKIEVALNDPSPSYGFRIVGEAIDFLPFYEEDEDEDEDEDEYQTEDELLLDVSGTLISLGRSKIKSISIIR